MSATNGHSQCVPGRRPRPRDPIRPTPAAILPSMTSTLRRFGAQSMSAPLLEVLVKRPGPAFGRAFDDPAHGFLHPVDLELARARARRVRRDAGPLGPTVHVLEAETATARTSSTPSIRCSSPIAGRSRCGPASRTGPASRRSLEAWTAAAGIPTVGAHRGARDGRGRRHALAPAGPVLHRADAPDQRRRRAPAGRAGRRRRPDLRRPVLARAGRADPPHVGHLAGRRRPRGRLPAAAARSGSGQLLGELGIRLIEVPDDEFPTLGCNVLAVRPGRRHPRRGQPADGGRARRRRLRGPHLSRRREIGDQRLRRADVHDPADPPWLSARSRRPRSTATGWSRTCEALDPRSRASPGPRRRSPRGPPRRCASSASRSRSSSPDPAAIRADPDWPGEEMPRTSLPVVIGRAGRPGGRRIILSGHLDVVPPGDPATWTADPWGGEIRDGALYGRGACDMKGGVAAILAAVRALERRGRPRSPRRRADRRARPVRGGRRAGHARGDPGRRDRRPGDHPGAVEPRHRRRPRRRHHVPADRPGPGRPRLAAPRRRLRARQAVRPLRGARGRRDAPERRRDRSADDGARAAVSDDHRDRGGRGVGVDRAGPGHRRRPLRRAARAVAGRRRGGAARRDRRRLRRGRVPARPPGDRRDHRRPVRIRRACRRITRCRSGSPMSPSA